MANEVLIVPDTNIFIHDPKSIKKLKENGNKIILPWVVITELDSLKTKPDIGFDAREVLSLIEELRLAGDPKLEIRKNPSKKSTLNLDRNNPDHLIIGTALELKNDKKNNGNVILLSRDRTVRLLGRELGLKADDYCLEQADAPKYKIKKIEVESKDIEGEDFFYSEDIYGQIDENEGVICSSDKCLIMGEKDWGVDKFAAIRKGDMMKVIDPEINALGVRPFSLNGDFNWAQMIALYQLLDPSIQLVFLQGGAGTGKTLLALASAIGQRSMCNQIIITRPMIHLEDEDRMGFLPGDYLDKLSPWVIPIRQALHFLKDDSVSNSHKSVIQNMEETKKLDFLSLDYIRGMSFNRYRLIVDDAQNLTPHQVKTIITRAGMNTKVIFTGDIGQIDRRRRLDEKSSGLTYAMNRMSNHPLVGITTFKETVRSPLAKLAEEVL